MGCRFMYDNQWREGTLYYSTQNANFPASNTRHRWFTKTYRSTADAGQYLVVDRGGSSPSLQAFIVKFNNYSGSATVRWEANGSNSWGSPTFNSGALTPNNDIMVHFATAAQALQWIRHYVDDGSNPDNYIEIGYLFAGPYFQPTRNYDWGEMWEQEDPSRLSYSEGGQLASVIRDSFFTQQLIFQHVTPAQKALFDAMHTAVGKAKPFFFCGDTDNPTTSTYFVRLTRWAVQLVEYNNWTVAMTLEEMR